MLIKSTLAALALTASMATASVAPAPSADAPKTAIVDSYEVADTRGMDNRQDRRADRQGCRQSEGAGHDKRDCKQDNRANG